MPPRPSLQAAHGNELTQVDVTVLDAHGDVAPRDTEPARRRSRRSKVSHEVFSRMNGDTGRADSSTDDSSSTRKSSGEDFTFIGTPGFTSTITTHARAIPAVSAGRISPARRCARQPGRSAPGRPPRRTGTPVFPADAAGPATMEPVLQRVAHADGDARREVEQEGMARRRACRWTDCSGTPLRHRRRCRAWQRRWRTAPPGTRASSPTASVARNARGASRHTPLRKNRLTSRSAPHRYGALPAQRLSAGSAGAARRGRARLPRPATPKAARPRRGEGHGHEGGDPHDRAGDGSAALARVSR